LKAKLPSFKKSAADLLKVPVGQVSLSALEHNISVATLFIEAWLRRMFLLCSTLPVKQLVTKYASKTGFLMQNREHSHSVELWKTRPQLRYLDRKFGSGFSTG
jgi:hypothetical protein